MSNIWSKRFKTNIVRRFNENIRKNEKLQLFQTIQTLIEDKLRTIISDEITSLQEIQKLEELEELKIHKYNDD